MTLQEAIKSGKPFKLPHYKSHIIVRLIEGKGYFFHEDTNTAVGIFSPELILSEKWETKPDLPDNVVLFSDIKKRKKIKV